MAQDWEGHSEFREVSFSEFMNSRLSDVLAGSPTLKLLFGGVILFIIALIVFNSYFIVKVGEEGVVRRLGKYTASKPEGIHFKIPIIEKVDIVEVAKTQTEQFGFRTEKAGIKTQYSPDEFPQESEMLTGDMNIVDLYFEVQYRIKDAAAFLFNVRSPVKALRNAAESSMRQVIGDHGFDEALGTEEGDVSAEEISTLVKEKLQQLMDKYESGILVVNVTLKQVEPPRNVRPAWDDVNKAEQYKRQMENLAQQKLLQALPKARGNAKRLIAEAKAYKIERINRAKGEKEKFLNILKEYQLAKEITRRRIFLETMEEILAGIEDKIVIDEDVSDRIFNLLNLNQQ